MENKYIVIDIRMINSSGIGTYIENIVYRVVNNFRENKYILLVNNSSNYYQFIKKMRYENYEIIIINSPIFSIQEQFEIIKKIPSNILLFWSTNYNIPILLKTKFLVTIHDMYHCYDNSIYNIIRKIYAYCMINIIKYKKCKIIAVSNFTKNEIQKYINIKNKYIAVVYNGLGKEWYSNRNYYNNNNILYVGNMKKHKNVLLLIKAFKKVNRILKMKLYLVGKMDDRLSEELRCAIVDPNIKVIDYVDKNELLKYYNKARLLIHPSIYEGFGFTPLEAMACNCPVLASDAASIPEVCNDGAYYFESNNINDLKEKILYLINNKEINDKLVRNGKNVVEKYLWKNSTIKTIKTLKNHLSL